MSHASPRSSCDAFQKSTCYILWGVCALAALFLLFYLPFSSFAKPDPNSFSTPFFAFKTSDFHYHFATLFQAVALPVLLVAGFPRSQFNCLIIYMGPAFRPTCWLPFRRIPKPRWGSSVPLSMYAWAEQGNEFQSPSSMVWPTSTGYHTRRDPLR